MNHYLNPDILVPELRVRRDEARHEADARPVLEHLDRDAARTEQRLLADERLILTDDDRWNPVQENGAAAHGARRQRGVQHAFAIDGSRLAAGVLERVHFPVEDHAPALHATVVTATDDPPLVHEHGADRNTSFARAEPGFVDGRLHEFLRHTFRSQELGGRVSLFFLPSFSFLRLAQRPPGDGAVRCWCASGMPRRRTVSRSKSNSISTTGSLPPTSRWSASFRGARSGSVGLMSLSSRVKSAPKQSRLD